MTPFEAFCRAEAPRRGITPDVAVWVCNSEGGLTEAARVGRFATGWSWWALQLHYGGAGYEQFGTTAGMGNSFTKLTGWAPGDPRAWRDALRYGLDQARAGGWGPWYGAKKIGVTGFYGIDRSVPWSGTPASEWDYQTGSVAVGDVTPILQQVIALGKAEQGKPYTGPVVGQPDSTRYGNPGYDCSSFVSEMYKRATGGAIALTPFTDAAYGQCDWQQQPQPGDIVFYHYPDSSQPGVTWPHMGIWLATDQVLDCRFPEGVGIRAHVTPVQAGNRYRQTMRPKGLAAVAPPATPPAADERDALIAQLRKELDEERTKLGVITVDYAAQLENILKAIRELRPAS